MATATKEPIKTEPPKPTKYVMPACNIGERVVYYNGADQNMPKQFGHVIEVNGCDVTVRVMNFFGGDEKKFNVCHVSDPRLGNQNIRVNGSWDFHPDTKLLRDLQERVKVLEELK